MDQGVLFSLGLIVILGVLAQYVSWRFRLPSILLLLIFGVLAGPVSGLIDSDELFGKLLFPLVSLSVAIILFEGGLSLRFRELAGTGSVLWMLVTAGALVTWLLSIAGARWLLGLSWPLSILLGAILVVTGPTVIVPLLRHVRPRQNVGAILKWEGILIDPIGAILAVLAYEAIIIGINREAVTAVAKGLLVTAAIGGAAGAAGAGLLCWLIRQRLVPDFLENAVSLMVVLAGYVAANLLQHESGLLAVTVMGVILANQKIVSVERIGQFKEDLRVLLISILFIILSARLQSEHLGQVNLLSIMFLAGLIFIVRPAAVAISTIGSRLKWSERLFLATMAPRGIVAAAVSSIFALRLIEQGQTEAARLMPLTFLVIIGTVTFYGLLASPVGRLLGVSQPNPQGFLIVGAHSWARKIAQSLRNEGFFVMMADTSFNAVNAARMEGLTAIYGSALSEPVIEAVETSEIGRVIGLTSNYEVNSLVAVRFGRIFDRKETYQLYPHGQTAKGDHKATSELQGRFLFGQQMTYYHLAGRFNSGAVVKSTKLTEEFDFDAFKKHHDDDNAMPMFLIRQDEPVEVFTTETTTEPRPGDTLISLVTPAEGQSDG